MMINRIIDYLDELFPNPRCELEYTKDYELLMAIVMSAQTTDKRVNEVNRVLFNRYKSIYDIANAIGIPQDDLLNGKQLQMKVLTSLSAQIQKSNLSK